MTHSHGAAPPIEDGKRRAEEITAPHCGRRRPGVRAGPPGDFENLQATRRQFGATVNQLHWARGERDRLAQSLAEIDAWANAAACACPAGKPGTCLRCRIQGRPAPAGPNGSAATGRR
jgi:hypothetical protein